MAQWLNGTVLAIDFETARALALDLWRAFETWASAGADRAPILMVGLAMTASIPLLALAGWIVNRSMSRRAALAALPGPPPSTTAIISPQRAWITGDGGISCLLCRDLHSIGREDDNDVQLADASVHRHHAVVHHADDTRFFIRDLSGIGGNGVRVNGQRVAEAPLAAGDVIEVGTVRLRFEARAT